VTWSPPIHEGVADTETALSAARKSVVSCMTRVYIVIAADVCDCGRGGEWEGGVWRRACRLDSGSSLEIRMRLGRGRSARCVMQAVTCANHR
jgi:hypothetical protein